MIYQQTLIWRHTLYACNRARKDSSSSRILNSSLAAFFVAFSDRDEYSTAMCLKPFCKCCQLSVGHAHEVTTVELLVIALKYIVSYVYIRVQALLETIIEREGLKYYIQYIMNPAEGDIHIILFSESVKRK